MRQHQLSPRAGQSYSALGSAIASKKRIIIGAGQVRSAHALVAQSRAGHIRVAQVRAAQVRAGQDRVGQISTAQVRVVQICAEQGPSGKVLVGPITTR